MLGILIDRVQRADLDKYERVSLNCLFRQLAMCALMCTFLVANSRRYFFVRVCHIFGKDGVLVSDLFFAFWLLSRLSASCCRQRIEMGEEILLTMTWSINRAFLSLLVTCHCADKGFVKLHTTEWQISKLWLYFWIVYMGVMSTLLNGLMSSFDAFPIETGSWHVGHLKRQTLCINSHTIRPK